MNGWDRVGKGCSRPRLPRGGGRPRVQNSVHLSYGLQDQILTDLDEGASIKYVHQILTFKTPFVCIVSTVCVGQFLDPPSQCRRCRRTHWKPLTVVYQMHTKPWIRERFMNAPDLGMKRRGDPGCKWTPRPRTRMRVNIFIHSMLCKEFG